MTSNCEAHKKKILYYCLDKSCKKNPSCCVICIKNDHNKCKDELLVECEEAINKV